MHSLNKKATKPLTQLKTIHNEHYAKLQSKHLAESELLDDLRPNGQSVWRVWRTMLEESNNLALARLRASDSQQRLSRELKPLKLQRLAVNKRVFEQLRTLQGDLAACVQEMVKSHKVYAEEEKQAQETRLKTMATEEKIRRRSTDIFHSMAQLHRTYEKLISRRQAYDERSATARNEYLFQLAAINSHLKHYFIKDVPSLVKTLDGELYEKLREVLSTLGQSETEICALTRERFQRIFKEAAQITRTYAWENFLKCCPLFDKTVQYQFEPLDGDETTLLRSPDTKEASLEQIARKLARRLVLRERRIKSYENELKTLQAGCANPYPSAQPSPGSPDFENNEELLSFNQEYVEHKVDEIQFAIRREEIERVKIEACLALLRNSSIEVKQCVSDARAAAEVASVAAMAQQLRGGVDVDLLDLTHPRPTGEGSSDSVSSGLGRFADPHLDYTRSGYDTVSGYPFRSGYGMEMSYGGSVDYAARSYTPGAEKWSSTAPRPTTIGQASNSLDSQTRHSGDSPKPTAWNSMRSLRSGSHDYQNVIEAVQFTRDDLSVDLGRSSNGPNASFIARETTSDTNTVREEPMDLELIWSEHGRLRQASVLYEFRAKRPTELDLVVHETVVLLEKQDTNGWIKVRSLIDGNEGLVPIRFLRLHDSTPFTSQPPRLYDAHSFGISGDSSDEVRQQSSSGNGDLEVHYTAQTDDNLKNGHVASNGTSTSKRTPQSRQMSQNHDVNGRGDRTHSVPPHTKQTSVDVKTNGKNSTDRVKDLLTTKLLPQPGLFVRTLINFAGNNTDELRFDKGAVIRVLGRAPAPSLVEGSGGGVTGQVNPTTRSSSMEASETGVDDGFWEGELIKHSSSASNSSNSSYSSYTRCRGVFPSMLVQQLDPCEKERWTRIWQNSVSTTHTVATVANTQSKEEKSKKATKCTSPEKKEKSGYSQEARQVSIPEIAEDYIQWSPSKVPHHITTVNHQTHLSLSASGRKHDPCDEELQIAEV